MLTPVLALARLVATIRDIGGDLQRDGERLRYRIPRLDADARGALLAMLAKYRSSVLALLDAPGDAEQGREMQQ